jgi:DNA invertase Pin-like site-specific DNA recombinase
VRVAIYARVSTEEQNVENQIPVLEEFAARNDWQVVKTYAEEASAWELVEKTALDSMPALRPGYAIT